MNLGRWGTFCNPDKTANGRYPYHSTEDVSVFCEHGVWCSVVDGNEGLLWQYFGMAPSLKVCVSVSFSLFLSSFVPLFSSCYFPIQAIIE